MSPPSVGISWGRFLGAFIAVFLFLHLFWAVKSLVDAHRVITTKSNLRMLAALTIRNFPDRSLDSVDFFWQSINREGNPMKDLWGTEFLWFAREERGEKRFFWSSAGPDRSFGTADDIRVEVPYPSGPGNLPDLAPGEFLEPPPISSGAK